jgi:protein-L-isoaspartate(D-aspartate) O-methyltransferase
MDFALLRHRMVQHQLRGRGIADERVLAAMEETPRHSFMPEHLRNRAYEDEPLPIGLGQTISQPYMVARMTELLRLQGTETVLEIGTGSGYQAAVLSRLAKQIWTIERHPELARRAEEALKSLGYDNVRVVIGDGSLGLPEQAPFDAIVVTAAAPTTPRALCAQLKPGGRMVIPVSAGYVQDLRLIERLPAATPSSQATAATPSEGAATAAPTGQAPDGKPRSELAAGEPQAEVPLCELRETSILGCVFVPLIGEQGYKQ